LIKKDSTFPLERGLLNMKENIGVSGTWLFVWRDKDGNILETREEHNLITQSGLEAIAALFIGELPQSNAMYLALGTGTTASASGNTKLQVEGYRKILTSKTRNLNEVRLRFFLTTGEAVSDNWVELGVMLAATDMPDSGKMLNRILPSGGIRKASNQTLTIEVRLRFQGVS
jgi:hypothetical protein